ncbi:methyltransferase domain-containing protein [Methylocystis sp. ATCC 49242]|jgi:hypothetical protein|uniref:methyltransferase domain-containing protein n=1 Tax=Methylocystis sp. ATCC 49242 TaxID=622637 RepID=UPI003528AAC9
MRPGGTATWFHHGWGQVVGLDVDQKSIDHARATDVEFVALNVGRLADWRTDPFDFVCLFNSFYALKAWMARLEPFLANLPTCGRPDLC